MKLLQDKNSTESPLLSNIGILFVFPTLLSFAIVFPACIIWMRLGFYICELFCVSNQSHIFNLYIYTYIFIKI